MFNPDAKLINCYTCGDITEQKKINGKVIKNCTKCRELNNNKKKQNKNNEPKIKYEATPPEGFYKSDSVLYLDNVKEQEEEQDSTTTSEEQDSTTTEEQAEQEETEEQQKQRRQEEHEQKLKQAREEQEAEYKRILKEKEEQQETEQPKEPTIKELLQEINIKLNKPDTTNNNNKEPPEEITTILNNLFKQMDETHNYIILSHKERKEDHEQITEFIKQQELKNKIIINKLDRIINAIT